MPQLIIHQYHLPGDILPEPSGLACLDRILLMPPSSSSMSWIQSPWSYTFDLLGIFFCFCGARLFIESWKGVHIWNALHLSCYLTKNLVVGVIPCWKNKLPWNIGNIDPRSYCCHKFCRKVQSCYHFWFLYFILEISDFLPCSKYPSGAPQCRSAFTHRET